MRLVIAVLMTIASGAFVEAACTKTESEVKVIEVINMLQALLPRGEAKTIVVVKKFEQALGEAKKPTQTAQEAQASTDKLCTDLDQILVELGR